MAQKKVKAQVEETPRKVTLVEVVAWVAVVGAAVILLVALGSRPPRGSYEARGEVKQSFGQWIDTQMEGTTRLGRRGLTIRAGDRIEVLPDAGARIALNNGSVVVLDAGTKMTIHAYSLEIGGMWSDPEDPLCLWNMELKAGRLMLMIQNWAGHELETPRGTFKMREPAEMEAKVTADVVEVAVVSGTVEMKVKGSKERQAVKAGEIVRLRDSGVERESSGVGAVLNETLWTSKLGVIFPTGKPSETGALLRVPEEK